jgi:hypothetical protein
MATAMLLKKGTSGEEDMTELYASMREVRQVKDGILACPRRR